MNHHSLTSQRSHAEASGRDVSTFKVIKKLTPGSHGAQKLQDLYRHALFCGRHRITADGKNRCTTVELLLEQTAMRRRVSPVVGVQIAFAEKDLQPRARAVGATWDPSARLWKMPRKSAEMLGLTERVHRIDQWVG